MSRKAIRQMAGERVMRVVDSIRHELRYRPKAVLRRLQSSRELRNKREALDRWHRSILSNPPDVLLGANVNKGEGIRNHMLGIRQNSSLRIELSPPDYLLDVVTYHDLHTTLREEVMRFSPAQIGAIHSHVYPYFIEWCARHRGDGPVWIHTYHLPYFPLNEHARLEPWQEDFNRTLVEVARNAHVRLSVSRWQQQYLESTHRIATDYLPNGVDVAICDRADAAGFKIGHGVDDFVLFVGRDDPVKNPVEFLRLAQALESRQFVMIGSGLDVAWALRYTTEVPRNLILLGTRSRDEVMNALAACSALVVTSIYEGLPTLVLEAMALGRPIVVSNEPGSVEAINHGDFGFIYEPGNVVDLKAKTLAALNGPSSREAARQRILEEYDWRVVAAKLDAIYQTPPG